MGDTTNFLVIIEKAPKRRHRKILAILEAHCDGLDWAEGVSFDTLELGAAYTTNLGHPGEADELAAELIAAAPEASLSPGTNRSTNGWAAWSWTPSAWASTPTPATPTAPPS
jgi:hypothetical protein